ncbi:MAG: hypothetical protein HC867_05185 [Bacteroidia bacterium]|nr:hypothetical protein [Bacteroidia bacterium]
MIHLSFAQSQIFFSAHADSFASKKTLFSSEEVFDIALKGKVRDVLNDRAVDSKYHPLVLAYKNDDSAEINIPVEVKTRGHFRKLRANCFYPPLQIKFAKKEPQTSSVFGEQLKLKLVMPCKGEEFIIREWLAYKLYNLVTEKSFRARLVRVKLEDERSKKPSTAFYGMLLEEEHQLAKRNNTVSVERKLKPEQTQPDAFLAMAMFQYMIGNTDWSTQYMQNIKFLAPDSHAVATAVPYDFDHAGIVGAPYARPAEELLMSSVRQRRYRGYCVQDIKVFDPVIEKFNRLKNDIYAVYTGCLLLDEKYKNSTVKYLDEFYATINNPVAFKKDFLYPCEVKREACGDKGAEGGLDYIPD